MYDLKKYTQKELKHKKANVQEGEGSSAGLAMTEYNLSQFLWRKSAIKTKK